MYVLYMQIRSSTLICHCNTYYELKRTGEENTMNYPEYLTHNNNNNNHNNDELYEDDFDDDNHDYDSDN